MSQGTLVLGSFTLVLLCHIYFVVKREDGASADHSFVLGTQTMHRKAEGETEN